MNLLLLNHNNIFGKMDGDLDFLSYVEFLKLPSSSSTKQLLLIIGNIT